MRPLFSVPIFWIIFYTYYIISTTQNTQLLPVEHITWVMFDEGSIGTQFNLVPILMWWLNLFGAQTHSVDLIN